MSTAAALEQAAAAVSGGEGGERIASEERRGEGSAVRDETGADGRGADRGSTNEANIGCPDSLHLPLLPSLPCGSSSSNMLDPLPRWQVWAYGTGHMLNDLTAACWFTYLLIFLTDIGLSPQQGGMVMMAGQLADAAATLVAGNMIDRFGHFIRWHLAGSLLVALSFSSVFGGCIICSLLPSSLLASNLLPTVQTVSYSFFAAVFNCGWAATQVSHMSLVNCLTQNPTSQVALNSSRNAFTMVANLSLYLLAFFAFSLLPGSTAAQVQLQFRLIAAGAIVLGWLLLLFFFAGVKEPLRHHFHVSEAGCTYNWRWWLNQTKYFRVAVIYTATRLTTNVSQALLPFFLINDLAMSPASKAIIPGTIFVASFVISIMLQEFHWSCGRLKAAFAFGSCLWLCFSVGVFFLSPKLATWMYPLALIIGTANSLLLVSATSMEGALVGKKISGCAFVYGSLSFLDKVSCGIVLYITVSACQASSVRGVLMLLPASSLVVALLAMNNLVLDDDIQLSKVDLALHATPLLSEGIEDDTYIHLE